MLSLVVDSLVVDRFDWIEVIVCGNVLLMVWMCLSVVFFCECFIRFLIVVRCLKMIDSV